MPDPDAHAYTFCEAIVRGWGIAFTCVCGAANRWTDASLAERFLKSLDRPLSDLGGKVKCPTCGNRNTGIYPYQAGTLDWGGSKALCDTPNVLAERETALRKRARMGSKATDQTQKSRRPSPEGPNRRLSV